MNSTTVSQITERFVGGSLILWGVVFIMSCGKPQAHLQTFTSDDGIEIVDGDSKVLFYQVKPKSLDGKFERASYIHPLYSLDGNVITEDFPEDHPHHHGIYSAWHQIILGKKVVGDGWTGENISWKVSGTDVKAQEDRVTLSSKIQWNASSNGKLAPIVNEDLEITVHTVTDGFRIIDYDFTLVPLVDSVMIGGSDDEKGYGGFSLRFKLPDDIRFIARGNEVEAKVTSVDAGPWMNFAGSFDGKDSSQSGVVVLCHPSNPGSPQPWILRKEKSMQNPAFPGRQAVELRKEGLSLRYRIVIHKGLNEPRIEELYQAYSKDVK